MAAREGGREQAEKQNLAVREAFLRVTARHKPTKSLRLTHNYKMQTHTLLQPHQQDSRAVPCRLSLRRKAHSILMVIKSKATTGMVSLWQPQSLQHWTQLNS